MSYEELDRASVIQQVIEGRLTQRAAATMLGLKPRQVRRLCRAYEKHGPAGLASKRRGRPSNRRLSEVLRRQALELVRSRYEGFGPTLAHEKLTEIHGLELSVETLRHWMTEDGLWIPRAARKPRIQQPRRRRPSCGELVQIDGCDHEWFEDRGPRCTALVYVDDATGALMELLFCESESAFSYFEATRGYLERYGRPVALYSDKAGVFRVNAKEAKGGDGVTQFGRAMHSLNIDIICANTPAAKGRVERAHLTLQDRLVKEMRLRGISDIAAANGFAEEYRADYNRRFARAPRSEHDAHRPLRASDDLDRLFTWQETRKVSKNLTLNYKRVLYLLDETDAARSARGQRVGVEEHEDGAVSFWWGGQELPATAFPKETAVRHVEVVENKRLNAALEFIKAQQQQRVEAKVAKTFTTLRDAKLLHAGTHRRTPTANTT
ncbi:MAG: ISNCY family transposase [Proteobacteria bacterium]|nr:ISNCY family transposase [Actinomycetales bacterium]MCP4915425.1 ISNCY family transposase [Pseudomonadota bacterium]